MPEFPEWQLGFLHECGQIDMLPILAAQVPQAKAMLPLEVVANKHLRTAVVWHFALEADPVKPGCHVIAGTPVAGATRTDTEVNGIMWSYDG